VIDITRICRSRRDRTVAGNGRLDGSRARGGRSQAQTDLSAAGGYAVLGALVDHLFSHAASDGSELALLARASDLCDRGVGLYNELGSVRDRFETALGNPGDPAALTAFNTVAMDVQLFAQKAYAMQGEVGLFGAEYGGPLVRVRRTVRLCREWRGIRVTAIVTVQMVPPTVGAGP